MWAGKRVLVTGADGFLGSHLTEKLLSLGAEVSVLVRGTSVVGTYEFRLKNLQSVKPKLRKIIAVDVSTHDALSLIVENRPEVIFHLAAIAYVPYSFDRPEEVFRVNAGGTQIVLDAARRLSSTLKRLVITSSSEIYGTVLTEKISELHPLNPTSPYAASKVAADRLAFSYYTSYGLPIAIIRPFNFYGPRHTYDVVPKFVDLVMKGEPPIIYGDGKQSRDLTYVSDMVDAFLLMGSHEKAVGQTVNFGTGVEHSVEEVARVIINVCGKDLKPVYTERRVAEVQRLTCDSSKAKELFGWEAKVGLEEGVRLNVAFNRDRR